MRNWLAARQSGSRNSWSRSSSRRRAPTMASEAQAEAADSTGGDTVDYRSAGPWGDMQRLLRPLASLRLTVVLLVMAIFIVFAGTLAQVDKDIWDVVHQYFRSSFARIDLQIFFPRSMH